MKTLFKRICLSSLMILAIAVSVSAQKKKKADNDTKEWRYEIEAVATGGEGSYLIKVWSYSKKPEIAIEQAKKNAVHGVIFKGFAAIQGVPGQKPLAQDPNVEMEKAEFFDSFFSDGGKYMKFVSVSNDGAVAAEDRMKIGKEYKVGVVVTVMKDNLRKDLEAAGIIKGLGSMF
ncbi:MAG: hypothetical protein KJ607_08445 [Bacteroidetes bacterium]|nr:hypothetical protein [Bacteroidota bacterium]